MTAHCSDFRTLRKRFVAKIENDAGSMRWQNRYMDSFEEWFRRAYKVMEAKQPEITQESIGEMIGGQIGRKLDRSIINKILIGRRKVKPPEMWAMSRLSGMPLPEGAAQPTSNLIGRAEAGGAVHTYGESQVQPEPIPVPGIFGAGNAIEIAGNSLGDWPAGWYAFIGEMGPVTDDIGKLCVVETEDHELLIKTVRRAKAKNLYHLFPERGEPLLDVKLRAAAKVLMVAPKS
jgi:hypothetical protein